MYITWRQLFRTLLLFVLLMIIINGVFTLIKWLLSPNDGISVTTLYESYMYMLGYSTDSNVPYLLLATQAVVGFFTVALFSAYLTFKVFVRDEDVLLLDKCFIMQEDDRFALGLLLDNRGAAILDVDCQIRAYNPKEDQEGPTLHTYRPVVDTKKNWKIKIVFDRNEEIFKYLEKSFKGADNLHIDVLIKSIDSRIGLQTIFHKVFNEKAIIFMEKEKFEQLDKKEFCSSFMKKAAIAGMNNQIIEERFKAYVMQDYFDIDLSAMETYSSDSRRGISKKIIRDGDEIYYGIDFDFSKYMENGLKPEWLNAAIPIQGQDWSYYVRNNYKLYLELESDDLEAIDIEIKATHGEDHSHLYLFRDDKHPRFIRLSELKNKENAHEMREICLTYKPDKHESSISKIKSGLVIRKLYLAKEKV